LNNEAEVKSLLKTFYQTPSTDCFGDLLKFVWSLDLARKAMKDMLLDIGKLPVGQLKIERVKKSLAILHKIQLQL
jgi:hypothetical protein